MAVTICGNHFISGLQMGDYEIPTSVMMEKQKVVIDQLRRKLDLDLENFNKLS